MPTAEPRRLLLVESHLERRLTWSADLGRLGWIVDEAEDVPTAIDRAVGLQPQVIMMNTHLLTADVQPLVRTLRGVVEHDVVIVGLVTLPDPGDNIQRAGFDFLLRAPFDFALFGRKDAATTTAPDDERPTQELHRRRF